MCIAQYIYLWIYGFMELFMYSFMDLWVIMTWMSVLLVIIVMIMTRLLSYWHCCGIMFIYNHVIYTYTLYLLLIIITILEGTIPSELGKLILLSYLTLYANSLEGMYLMFLWFDSLCFALLCFDINNAV